MVERCEVKEELKSADAHAADIRRCPAAWWTAAKWDLQSDDDPEKGKVIKL